MSTAPKKGSFDPVKLAAMVEPLIVRVERLRGSNRQPIELPEKPGGEPPGVGWTREDVQRLEFWLVREWAGGGAYSFLVSDNNGTQMSWESVWDPKMFPEKPLPGSPVGGPAQPTWAPPPPVSIAGVAPVGTVPGMTGNPLNGTTNLQQSGATSWVGWPSQPSPTPMAMSMPMQAAAPATPPSFTGFPSMAMPPGGWNGWGNGFGSGFGPGRRRNDDDDREPRAPAVDLAKEQQLNTLREELKRAELERIKAQHEAEMEKTRQQAAAALDQLRAEIRQAAIANAPRESDEALRLREERQRFEREQLEAKREADARAERERAEAAARAERQRVDDQFRMMQENMLKIVEGLKSAQAAPVGPDPKITALETMLQRQQEEAARQREELARERAERDRRELEARREAEHKEELRRIQDQMARQADETRRLIEAAQTPRGPDPMIEFMKESARTQNDAIREIARLQQTASDKMQNLMMSPQSVISLVKDASNGTEHMMRNMTGFYTDMFQTMRQATEHALQLQGGSPPSMIEGVIERASGMVDKYLDVKRDTTVAEAKVKQTQATAQAELMKRQAEMVAMTRGLNGAGAPVQQPQPAPAARPVAQQPRPVQPQPVPQRPVAVAPTQQPAQPVQTPVPQTQPTPTDTAAANSDPAAGAKIIPLRKHGRTDEEWFGIALRDVQKLREVVGFFLDGLKQDPPIVDERGVDPTGAVSAVLRAATLIEGNNIPVEAFDKLFKQGLYADFAEVLLPEATHAYREEFTRLLIEAIHAKANPTVAGLEDEPAVTT